MSKARLDERDVGKLTDWKLDTALALRGMTHGFNFIYSNFKD